MLPSPAAAAVVAAAHQSAASRRQLPPYVLPSEPPAADNTTDSTRYNRVGWRGRPAISSPPPQLHWLLLQRGYQPERPPGCMMPQMCLDETLLGFAFEAAQVTCPSHSTHTRTTSSTIRGTSSSLLPRTCSGVSPHLSLACQLTFVRRSMPLSASASAISRSAPTSPGGWGGVEMVQGVPRRTWWG